MTINSTMISSFVTCLCFLNLISPVFGTPVDTTLLPGTNGASLPRLNVFVKDSNGNDISDRVSIFDNQPASSQHFKRAVARSRPITACPRGTLFRNFWYSRCNRILNPRSYTGYCRMNSGDEPDPNGYNIFAGQCNPDELCVDTFFPNGLHSTAFCITQADFIPYIQVEYDKKVEATLAAELAELGFFLSDDADTQYSVEAVVTSANTQESLSTSNLKIQAQKSTIVHDAPLWQTLAGGMNRCSGCGSVGLSVLPNGTQRFLLDVSLAAGVTAGKIWLTAWKPEL